MKFGRISRESPDGKVARLVLVDTDKGQVVDLARAAALYYEDKNHATTEGARRVAAVNFPGSMAQALSQGGDFLKEEAQKVASARADDASIDIKSVEWLPASDPPMLRDGLNFMGHLKGWSAKMNRALPESVERIVPYTQMSPTMNYGHEAVIEWPGYVKRMDYELELGWVIGRKGRNITPDVARDYVFGITMYNDWSGRDLQADELPIGMGGTKSKQFAHSIGPWITTMDEFKDFYSIEMEVRLNGKTMGKGLSDGVVWTVEEQIAFVALGEYIQPGDVIGSGTLGGGSALEHDVFLKPGDVVELEAKGVGVLRNTLGQPVEGLWWPTPQPGIMKT